MQGNWDFPWDYRASEIFNEQALKEAQMNAS